MPVNTHHPDYDLALPIWTRCRDAFAGTDDIKEAGEEYLPKLDAQDSDEYEAYKTRALWYGATARTVQGLMGGVFRKDPITDFPEKLLPQLDDITLDGTTFAGLAKQLLEEILVVGRAGLLVEMPAEDVPAEDRRPYWLRYDAEDIINWQTTRVNGQMVLSLVVLEETIVVDGVDIFSSISETQYRVLRLDEENLYLVDIWQELFNENDKTTTFILKETIFPKKSGKRLNFIPFTFVGVNGVTPDIEKPPLLDLVDVNISHYRSSADYEHGLHFTGLPTPYAFGFPEDSELKIGSGTAWVSTLPEGKVGMLEFTGQGLKPLADAIASKETKMATLGARLLEQQKAGVEAADSIRLRQSGEHGSLQSISATESQALTKALQWHADWAGADPANVRTQLNKDFYDTSIDPQMLTALIAAMQSGSISYETFYYNLQIGELARPGVEVEAERALIDAQVGAMTTPAPDPALAANGQ